MRNKLLCTISAVAMLSGLFVVAAAPAQAAPPTNANNFDPQDTKLLSDEATSPTELVLSDKFDGVDQLAHISSVATTDTTQAIYVVCPDGSGPASGASGGTEPVPPAGCVTIGTDNTGTTPAILGPGAPQVDEGYEFFWNIPAEFDGVERDVLAYHCAGAPTDDEPGGNCRVEREENVFLDDGATATNSSSAEYTEYCIDITDDFDCADAGETLRPFGHATAIPNLDGTQDLVVRARSSDDVTTLTSCLDTAADATGGSLNACTFSDSSGGQAAQAFRNHTFVYSAVPDNSELGFFLYERGGGSGNCATDTVDCELDGHYVVSTARQAQEARVFFDPIGNGDDPNDPEDVDEDSSCETPDREDTNRVGDDTQIRGCILDQFGDHLDTTVTFASDADGEFDDCGGGTLHDHDGDGVNEHCHHDSGGPDAEASAILLSTVPGTQRVTFCFDPENGGAAPNPPPADHGCGDETVVDTLDKEWIAGLPAHVHLVFEGTGSASNPCHTGAFFRQNEVGDRDELLACVFDQFDNPTTTDQTGGGFLEWFIDAGADDEVDTQFDGTPPPETGSDARATTTIRAINPGSDDPGVSLRRDNGTFVGSASVTKNVVPAERDRSSISIRHRTRPHRFTGRVTSDDDTCEPGRRVAVRRVRRGRDPVIGRDTTNANGRYRVNHNRTRRRFRYYARVSGNADCLGDRSPNTRRVR